MTSRKWSTLQSVCLSICLSVSVSIYLSICLSIVVLTHFYLLTVLLLHLIKTNDTQTHTQVGLVWTKDRSVAETYTRQHTTPTRNRHLFPWQDSNPKPQQASGLRPTTWTARPPIRSCADTALRTVNQMKRAEATHIALWRLATNQRVLVACFRAAVDSPVPSYSHLSNCHFIWTTS